MTNAVNIAQSGSNNQTFRNRIINGAMVIDQRNAGASYAQSTTVLYGLDRWKTDIDAGTGRWSVQQVSDAPTGFTNSLKVTITTQESQPASALHQIYQPIEGYNISDFGFGTANASPITVSFWVKTSVTGIYSLNVSSADYVYTTSYTVNSADTWEYKTITIPGATAGTWDITNEAGLYLEFTIGGGTDEIVTANTWRADTATGIVAGSVYLPATSGATWQVTGVQLEEGTAASPFENRLYGTELALCQRYFEKSFDTNVAPSNGPGATSLSTGNGVTSTVCGNNSLAGGPVRFAVPKRTAPTITSYGNNSGYWGYVSSSSSSTTTWSANTVLYTHIGVSSFSVIQNVTNNVYYTIYGHWVASAEL
jgi:hypothetical protein